MEHKEVDFGNKSSSGDITFKADLGALNGRIFALYNGKPQSIRFAAPSVDNYKRGQRAKFKVIAEPAQPGFVPGKVKIFKPDGTLSKYSITGGFVDGILEFEIDFAKNDRKGTWELAAQDMITLKKARCRISLK